MDSELRRAIKFDCIELSNAFAYHLDHREYRQLAELFVEDGWWNRHGEELRGHEAIVAALSQRQPNQFTRHVTTGHHFTELTADRAAATSYNISHFSLAEPEVHPKPFGPNQSIFLDFFDTYVRTPKGWRFATRRTERVMSPDLSGAAPTGKH